MRVCSGWYEELNSFAPVLLPSSPNTITLMLSFRQPSIFSGSYTIIVMTMNADGSLRLTLDILSGIGQN